MRITVTLEDVGSRLDKLLVKNLPGVGRAQVKRLFDKDRVRTIGPEARPRRAQKGDVCTVGQVIEVDIEEQTTDAVADTGAPIVVVLETDKIVVLDKPAGQPSAPLEPGEKGSLANALVARYPEMRGIGFSPREPGLCHRLDTDTSGLLVAARTKEAFETLTAGLRERRIDKRYLLLCAEKDLPDTGTIDIPLAPHPKDRKRVLACIHPRDTQRNAPRPATTTYRVVSRHGEVALVEATAPRALRHQIRAHFAAIEHPLYGDALYGGATLPGLARHALHAHRIAWPGDAIVPAFSAMSPLPDELARYATDKSEPEAPEA
jgi:23S rRNA pseudouridine1911/1915/1917 synthase